MFDFAVYFYDTFYHAIDHVGVWARKCPAYGANLALHFTVQGFAVFYLLLFSMFCPLWSDETTLGGLRLDYCLIQTNVEAAAALPMVFLWKKWPNYAPGAAPPLLDVRDVVMYNHSKDMTKCGGYSALEDCMLDSFKTPVVAAGTPTIVHGSHD